MHPPRLRIGVHSGGSIPIYCACGSCIKSIFLPMVFVQMLVGLYVFLLSRFNFCDQMFNIVHLTLIAFVVVSFISMTTPPFHVIITLMFLPTLLNNGTCNVLVWSPTFKTTKGYKLWCSILSIWWFIVHCHTLGFHNFNECHGGTFLRLLMSWFPRLVGLNQYNLLAPIWWHSWLCGGHAQLGCNTWVCVGMPLTYNIIIGVGGGIDV